MMNIVRLKTKTSALLIQSVVGVVPMLPDGKDTINGDGVGVSVILTQRSACITRAIST